MANNIRYRFLVNAYMGLDALSANRKPDHCPTIDGYQAGDPLALAYEGTISLEAYGDPRGVARYTCNQLFRMFNAPWDRPNEYAGPSMSVGDVIVLRPGTQEQMAFKVESVGFAPVFGTELNASKAVPAPARWVRSGIQLKEYLLAKQEDGVALTEEEENIIYGARS